MEPLSLELWVDSGTGFLPAPLAILTISSPTGPITDDDTPLVGGRLFWPGHNVNGVTITVKRNGVEIGTALTASGGAWSFQVTGALDSGDFLRAYGPGGVPASAGVVTYVGLPPSFPYLASSTHYRASSTAVRASYVS